MQPNELHVRNQVVLAAKVITDPNYENKKLKDRFEEKLVVHQSKLREDMGGSQDGLFSSVVECAFDNFVVLNWACTLSFICEEISLNVFKVVKNKSALPSYCIRTCSN